VHHGNIIGKQVRAIAVTDAPDDRDSVTSVATATGAPARTTPELAPYRFLTLLGEGGMGEVWLAEQLQPVRRQIAIKILKPGMDTAQVLARFEAERQALALMDHPAIAKVFGGGTTALGRPYFTMEYVRGEPITTHCDGRDLDLRERLTLFMQLCEGVQHAHQKGIIHRDLKPSNILISTTDDHPVPRIIDFGIAKAIGQPLTERPLYTEIGGFIGTPEYMSPEQAHLSPVDVDTRSDIYSLGVVLYELLTGVLPFDSERLRNEGVDDVRRTIRDIDPPRPSVRITQLVKASASSPQRGMVPAKRANALRGDLDWITMKALAKDRTRRYQTVNALALDIQRHLDNEPVSAGPPSASYRVGKFVRRHLVGVAVGATLGILIVTFGAITSIQARRIAAERDRANQEAVMATQISDFLVGLFEVSDPAESRGDTLTAREILANGARQIETELASQPAIRARLQATIGRVYTSIGMYANARSLLEDAYRLQIEVLGADSAETIATADHLADLHWYSSRYDEAEAIYEDILTRRLRLLGPEHGDTLKAAFDLGSVYYGQRRMADAERITADTLETQRRVLGPDHADTLASMNNLQAIYLAQMRYEEAEPIALEVLQNRRETLGNEHPQTLRALHNLGAIYSDWGRNESAVDLFIEALDGRKRVLGDTHPDTLTTQIRLAGAYRSLKRYEESEALSLAVYAALNPTFGAQHARTQRAVTELVRLYEAWDKPESVSTWQQRLVAR
jgi:non-specific serine/threonine protein kinase/serine/threonine-protein kinase